mgnify:CR=1 FL=1
MIIEARNKPRALVIDDEPSVGRSLTRVMSDRGYRVLVAHTAAEGIAKAREARPPVILIHGAGGSHLHWPAEIRRLRGQRQEVQEVLWEIDDIGPTLTHKKIIIQQFVRNIPTPEIARKTSHSEEACDRYIKGFKKVLKLHGDGIPAENIASELEMSKSLVREYVEIIEDLAEMKKG